MGVQYSSILCEILVAIVLKFRFLLLKLAQIQILINLVPWVGGRQAPPVGWMIPPFVTCNKMTVWAIELWKGEGQGWNRQQTPLLKKGVTDSRLWLLPDWMRRGSSSSKSDHPRWIYAHIPIISERHTVSETQQNAASHWLHTVTNLVNFF